jgi:phenylalanyl-tRNA synthetase beta chain
MLETVERNISRKNLNLSLFEKGKVFCANNKLYSEERLECCIALTGLKHPERFSEEKKELFDFFDLKGIIEKLFTIRKSQVQFRKPSDNCKALDNFIPGTVAEIIFHGKCIGHCGQTAKKLTAKMRLSTPLYIALIDVDPIIEAKQPQIRFKQIPGYPSTVRDIAFVAEKTLEHGTILETIKKAKVKNLEKIELFDIFEDEKLFGENKISMAYSLTYRNPERTLTDKEVNTAHDKLRNYLAGKLPLDLR